jgi:hypothetical protein
MASRLKNNPSEFSNRPKISLFTVFFLLVKISLPGTYVINYYILKIFEIVKLFFSLFYTVGPNKREALISSGKLVY